MKHELRIMPPKARLAQEGGNQVLRMFYVIAIRQLAEKQSGHIVRKK